MSPELIEILTTIGYIIIGCVILLSISVIAVIIRILIAIAPYILLAGFIGYFAFNTIK